MHLYISLEGARQRSLRFADAYDDVKMIPCQYSLLSIDFHTQGHGNLFLASP